MSSVPSSNDLLIYEFGPFRLDSAARRLFKGEAPVALAPKAFETLLYLVSNAGRAVKRQELLEAVWTDVVVSEASLDWAISMVRRSLGEGDDPVYVETVRGFGYRFAGKVTQRTAAPVSTSEPQAATTETPAPRSRRAAFVAGAVVVGLALALLAYRRASFSSPASFGHAPVAVLGFQNLSGDPANGWLSTALAEMLAADLAAGGRLRLSPAESVARLKAETRLPDSSSLSKESLAVVRRNLGARVVVIGSFVKAGTRAVEMRLDVLMQDTESGETIATHTETGSEDELFGLVTRTGARLRERLGAGDVMPGDAAAIRASLPADPEAARLYSEGLARLRRYDVGAARDLLTRSIAKEPGFALSHSALAETFSKLGEDGRAREESKKAIERAEGLPRAEKLLITGRAHEAAAEKPKAVDAYKALVAFFPDDLEYGLLLANAETAAGMPKDALAVVDSLRKLPEPQKEDARIDLAEAQAAEAASDLTRELAASARARKKAEGAEAWLLVAKALSLDAFVLETRGEPAKALASLDKARDIYRRSGDLGGLASTLRTIAQIRMQSGDFDGAAAAAEESTASRRAVGDRLGEAQGLNLIAAVAKKRGDLPKALATLRASYEAFKAIDVKRGMAMTLHNIASTLRDLGDFDGALKANEDALVLRREIGHKRGIALTLSNLVNDYRDRGDLVRAKRANEEALAIAQDVGAPEDIGTELLDQSILAFDADDLPTALEKAKESVAVFEKSGDAPELEQAKMNESMCLVEMGRGKEAEPAIVAQREAYRKKHVPAFELLTDVRLAECLLKEGREREAGEAIASALALIKESQDEGDRFELALVAARVSAASREEKLDAGLRRLLESTSKTGVFRQRLEARLALGSLARGNGSASGPSLAEVEADARRHDFLLVARKAAAARSGKIL